MTFSVNTEILSPRDSSNVYLFALGAMCMICVCSYMPRFTYKQRPLEDAGSFLLLFSI